MKKRIVIMLFSILSAFLLLPGGYGSWTDELYIVGSLDIVQPAATPKLMIMPIPVPTLVPVQDGIIPAIDGVGGVIPSDNPISVENELPNGSVPDSTHQDPGNLLEEDVVDDTNQQEQIDDGEVQEDPIGPEIIHEDNELDTEVEGEEGINGREQAIEGGKSQSDIVQDDNQEETKNNSAGTEQRHDEDNAESDNEKELTSVQENNEVNEETEDEIAIDNVEENSEEAQAQETEKDN